MEESERAELGLSGSDRAFILVGFPVVGAAVGAVLPWLWRVVQKTGFAPFQDAVSALLRLDVGWQVALRIVVLALVALGFGVYVVLRDVRVLVGPRDILVRRSGTTRRITHDEVASAYLDGKRLVVETTTGRKLLDAEVENAKKRAGAAFRRYDYPWANVD